MSDIMRLPSGDAPPFREPWQAKAFALVVLLYREDRFTWDDWVRTLSAEIAGHPQRADETAEFAYHRQFLTALETITAVHGFVSAEAAKERTEVWRRAYLNTPHGRPVELEAGLDERSSAAHSDNDHPDHNDDHHHGHHHLLAPNREPVAVSAGRVT